MSKKPKEETHFIPAEHHIKTHFEKAKEINCLRLNIKVDVSSVKTFNYNESDDSWNSIGNMICFWKAGKFAEITKTKCQNKNCTGCKPCEEQRKKLKNK